MGHQGPGGQGPRVRGPPPRSGGVRLAAGERRRLRRPQGDRAGRPLAHRADADAARRCGDVLAGRRLVAPWRLRRRAQRRRARRTAWQGGRAHDEVLPAVPPARRPRPPDARILGALAPARQHRGHRPGRPGDRAAARPGEPAGDRRLQVRGPLADPPRRSAVLRPAGDLGARGAAPPARHLLPRQRRVRGRGRLDRRVARRPATDDGRHRTAMPSSPWTAGSRRAVWASTAGGARCPSTAKKGGPTSPGSRTSTTSTDHVHLVAGVEPVPHPDGVIGKEPDAAAGLAALGRAHRPTPAAGRTTRRATSAPSGRRCAPRCARLG